MAETIEMADERVPLTDVDDIQVVTDLLLARQPPYSAAKYRKAVAFAKKR